MAKAALLIKLAWMSMLGAVTIAYARDSLQLARFIHVRITCIILGDGCSAWCVVQEYSMACIEFCGLCC